MYDLFIMIRDDDNLGEICDNMSLKGTLKSPKRCKTVKISQIILISNKIITNESLK